MTSKKDIDEWLIIVATKYDQGCGRAKVRVHSVVGFCLGAHQVKCLYCTYYIPLQRTFVDCELLKRCGPTKCNIQVQPELPKSNSTNCNATPTRRVSQIGVLHPACAHLQCLSWSLPPVDHTR